MKETENLAKELDEIDASIDEEMTGEEEEDDDDEMVG